MQPALAGNSPPGGLAVFNNQRVVESTEAVLRQALGPADVMRVPPITGSEDFSAFVNEGCRRCFSSSAYMTRHRSPPQ